MCWSVQFAFSELISQTYDTHAINAKLKVKHYKNTVV